jgi:hypothetical protein
VSVVDASADTTPFVGDYVSGVVGHAVLVTGRNHHGAESVAVWQIEATGQPTGAWILALDAPDRAATARRLLGVVQRRSVFGWDDDAAGFAMACLAELAEVVAPSGWKHTAVHLPDVLTEIADQRRRHAEAVTTYAARGGSKSKIAPLSWDSDVPADTASLPALAAFAGLPLLGISCEVVDRVLQLTRLVGWTARLWQDTEKARLRRRYLDDEFGPGSVLPPRWLAQLRAAAHSAASVEAALAGAA